MLWTELDKLGMQGITGVYVHGPGNRVICVISLKQRYLGHAKQVASVAGALLIGGACTGRYIITVDEDIDASNLDGCSGRSRRDATRRLQSTSFGVPHQSPEPMLRPEKRKAGDFTTAKVFMNACKPYHWIDSFPGRTRHRQRRGNGCWQSSGSCSRAEP
jgi:4-hydroxy-3-polyprenylbenzoate decarboxylase